MDDWKTIYKSLPHGQLVWMVGKYSTCPTGGGWEGKVDILFPSIPTGSEERKIFQVSLSVGIGGTEARARPVFKSIRNISAGGRVVFDIASETEIKYPPQISPFMFSSELREGSSAQALCGAWAGDRPLYFTWRKDGAPLPPALQVQEKSLGDFSLLVFPALDARHAGRYTCRVANAAAAAEYSADLSVKVPPAWTTEPSDVAVLLGAPLLLECAARGHPAPVVTWYRKVGESLSDPESDERWEEVSGGPWAAAGGALAAPAARGLRGRYRCRADNGVGAPLLKHVDVTVHEPAHFEEPAPRNVSALRGRDALLRCRARGDAPLSLGWTRHGRRLDRDSFRRGRRRWTVTESGGGDGAGAALSSELRLRAAEPGDAGEYRCVAANRYGRAEAPLHLHVEGRSRSELREPSAVSQASNGLSPRRAPGGAGEAAAGRRGRALGAAALGPPDGAARYEAALAPPPPLAPPRATSRWRGARGRGGRGGAAATLGELQPATAYALRVVAVNHVGSSPPSAPLLFTTLEEVIEVVVSGAAPSGAPLAVRARAAAPDELLVTWTVSALEQRNHPASDQHRLYFQRPFVVDRWSTSGRCIDNEWTERRADRARFTRGKRTSSEPSPSCPLAFRAWTRASEAIR
ncbi:hypothetical protein MSG28_011321 [Choristoneura fumiferana]|uniref:Uncharacterized protein n=1 Tax=Choristoneura fumiferana TaxID=7141 RepID=A0ACC0KS91_CHOFU|nr:hypothetical protein MSG28_011321 [Choristoneura fumiferana]